jgi:uncharacterized membrane protein YccC
VSGEHGTYAAYQRHRNTGSEPCTECRKAATRYMANYRASKPERRVAEIERATARNRALSRLAKLHPAQFRALYREELERQEVTAS